MRTKLFLLLFSTLLSVAVCLPSKAILLWQQLQTVQPGVTSAGYDMVCDANYVHVAYLKNGAITYARRAVGSNTWTTSAVGAANAAPSIAAYNGHVYIAYSNGTRVYVNSDLWNWVAQDVAPGWYGSIDVDGNGLVHLLYEANVDGDSYTEVCYTNYNGTTWSAPTILANGWYDSGSGNYFTMTSLVARPGGGYDWAYRFDNWGGRVSWSSSSGNTTLNGGVSSGDYAWQSETLTRQAIANGATGTGFTYAYGGNVYVYTKIGGTANGPASIGAGANPSIDMNGGSFVAYQGATSLMQYNGANAIALSFNAVDQTGTYPVVASNDTYRYVLYNNTGGTLTLLSSDPILNQVPTDIALSNATLAENTPANTEIGTLTATDPDAGETFSYSLVSGAGSTDNALFNIDGDKLRATSGLDYETKSSYSVRIQVTDHLDGTFEKVFTIAVTNVNEASTDITLTPNTVAEDAPIGTAVGTLLANDPDAGDTITYALVTGEGDTDNAAFTLDGDAVLTAVTFDYEAKTSYTIRVRATTDQDGLFIEKALTIAITNVNEAPTDIALSNSAVAENQPADTVVGTLSTTDPDAGNTFTYSLVTGEGDADNASFAIDGETVTTAAVFDFESQSSFTIRVRATDQDDLWTEKAFAISVTDANDAPTAIMLDVTSVAENTPAGFSLGELSATDLDDNEQAFGFSLVAGEGDEDNDGFALVPLDPTDDIGADISYSMDDLFALFPSSANVGSFTAPIGQSFTAGRSGKLTGVALGIGGGTNMTFHVTVCAGVGGAVLGSATVTGVDAGWPLLTFSPAIDVVAGQQYSLLISSPSDCALMLSMENRIPNAQIYTPWFMSDTFNDVAFRTYISNRAELVTTRSFDRETEPTLNIRLRVADSGNPAKTYEQAFTIDVTNVNETPTDIALSSTSVSEDAAVGDVVGTLTTTDTDILDPQSFTYTLVDGEGSEDNASFTVGAGGTWTNDYSTNIPLGSYSWINMFWFRDYDTSGVLPLQSFTADQTGTLQAFQVYLCGDAYGYLNNDGITVEVRAGEGLTGTLLATATCALPNLGWNTCTLPAGVHVTAGQRYSIVFTTCTGYPELAAAFSTDYDPYTGGQFIHPQLAIELPGANCDLALQTVIVGQDTLRTAVPLDYETKDTYHIRVRSTDQDGLFTEKAITIRVTNVNEAPTDITLSNASLLEGQEIGTTVGALTATDPDDALTPQAYAYTLVAGEGDTDNASFDIDGSSLITNAVLTGGTYHVRLRCTDQGSLYVEKTFTITVLGLQPDLAVKNDGASTYTGEDVYNTDQIASQTVATGVTATYDVQVGNDGEVADTIRLTGTAGGDGWTVRYFDARPGGLEMTNEVTTGWWAIGPLAAGETIPVRVTVTGDATVLGGTTCVVNLTATSEAYTHETDTVTMNTTKAPLTAVTITATPANRHAYETITLTAAAIGGGTVEYRFLARYKVGGVLKTTVIRDAFDTDPVCTWTPTIMSTYTFEVQAREVGRTAVVSGTTTYALLTAITRLTLTPVLSSPQKVGVPIHFTAGSTTIVPLTVEYQFWEVKLVSGVWTRRVLQNYGVGHTCDWTPPSTGNYSIQVYARPVGSLNAYEASRGVAVTVVPAREVLSVSLAATPTSPARVGTPIHVVATPVTVTPGAEVYYQFWLGTNSSGRWAWQLQQDYSTTNSFDWTPTVGADYAVLVYARPSYTTAAEASNTLSFRVLPTAVVTGLTVAVTPATPVVGTPAQIAITPSLASPATILYQVKVGYQDGGVWQWTLLQDFDSTATLTWTPAQARIYTIVVYAKPAGYPFAYEFSRATTAKVVPTPCVVRVNLTASPTVIPAGQGTRLNAQVMVTDPTQELEYQFLAKSTTGGTWTILQGYGSDSFCDWTPPSAGLWSVAVYVRPVGYPYAFEAGGSLTIRANSGK